MRDAVEAPESPRTSDLAALPLPAGVSREGSGTPVGISARLSLALVGTVLLVMIGYMVVSHHQRRGLLREGLAQDVELVGTILRISADDMLRDGRGADLDELLRLLLLPDEVFAAVILDATGSVVAGDTTSWHCLRRQLDHAPMPHPRSGRAACSAGVQWISLPLQSRDGSLVVGLEEVLLHRSATAALHRQILLLVVLTLTLSLAILVILRRVLSQPLDRIMTAVRTLAATGSVAPIRLDRASGEFVQLAEVINDTVTELEAKRAELMRQAEEQLALERRLRESEKFAVIGRVSGGLAHELGSPLTVITMRAEAIQAVQDAPPLVRRQAKEIASEVTRMSSFIVGLLHMTRQQRTMFSQVELTEIVRATAADLTGRAEQLGVELHVDAPPELIHVRGQDTLLRHALHNLVRNSIQALHDQPGERHIHIRVSRTEHEIRIVVEDNGPGITEDEMDRVFEPFFTTRQEGAGIGLGLPVSYGIIKEHGGELRLENREERGTRAVITLPLFPET
jgi:C4-dicarboxylate-specific signal transduction histidine kinase